MSDELTLTLSSPITEEEWDLISDVDFDHTDRIWFNTKHGKKVEFVKIPRWIPCSERLPEPNGHKEYLVTTAHYDPTYKGRFVMVDDYDARDPEGPPSWLYNNGEDGVRVVAWMPLPAPYTEAPT